jgi:hypothetical protein
MPKREQNPKELDRHRKAFEAYYGQGEKRSFPRMARELGVSVASLKVWSKAFGWQQRLRERDAAVARQAADQVIGSAVVNATRNRKMVELALMKVIKAINSDKVKIQVGDLDRLLRLQAFLDGDGVVLTAEALRQRPVLEVIDAVTEWMQNLLTDEELHMIIDARPVWRKSQPVAPDAPPSVPANPSLPVDGSPAQGEKDDEAPNAAG